MPVKDKVLQIVAHQALLDVDDINPDTTLAELGLDSLGMVEIVFAIEETFDVQIPFNANDPTGRNDGFDIRCVTSMIVAVEGLVEAQ